MGALSHRLRRFVSAAIQTATRHGFHASYSHRFRPSAGDNTTFPCGRHHTLHHILLRCPLLQSPRHRIFGNRANLNDILGAEDGGKKLVTFLLVLETNVLLWPLPLRPSVNGDALALPSHEVRDFDQLMSEYTQSRPVPPRPDRPDPP